MKRTSMGWLMAIVLCCIGFVSCVNEEEAPRQDYGYIQFALTKQDTKAVVEEIEYFSDISKIRVDMVNSEGAALSQTMPVSASDRQNAEYGLISDRWMLYNGDYTVTGYQLYDAVDEPLMTVYYDGDDRIGLTVTAGGLTMQELKVTAKKYGRLSLRLVKDNAVATKAGVDTYPFHMIKSVDVVVRSKENNRSYTFEKIPVKYKDVPADDNPDRATAVAVSDTLLTLPEGRYSVVSFDTYFDKKYKIAEHCTDVADNMFEITGGRTSTGDVPVTLNQAADYIKDAYALREIWYALDGPNWSYTGTAYPKGCNWEFDNRDVDLWLAQPGVKVLENGRVAYLDFESFGAEGVLPEAFGQLTELRQLFIGTHASESAYSPFSASADNRSSNVVTEEELEDGMLAMRRSFAEAYGACGDPRGALSDELKLGLELNGITVGEAPKPMAAFPEPGSRNYLSKVTIGEQSRIGNLKKLQTLYLAYNNFTDLPSDLKDCESLSDIEIFACHDLEKFPEVLTGMKQLVSLTMASNYKLEPSSLEAGLAKMNANARAAGTDKASRYSLQILQIPNTRMNVLPDLSGFDGLGMVNVQLCGIKKITAPFGKDKYMTSFIASYNEISEIPVDEYGYFLGLHSNFETFDMSHNKLTEVPNIFNGDDPNKIAGVDFSYNEITRLQGAEDGSWKGVNVEIFNLGYNRFESIPLLFNKEKSCSQVVYLILAGNRISEIPEAFLEGNMERQQFLQSLDLSVNMLENLPSNFNAAHLPYLYGIDLSQNRFDHFEFKPLNCSSLTTYVFRNQTDSEGHRCMKQWPEGIYSHKGLRALYIGNNDIGVVKDQKLSYLIYNLEIKGNENIVIDVSTICQYIGAGMFRLIYDKDQDIRGCDYLDLD